MRKLASQIALVSVSVYDNPNGEEAIDVGAVSDLDPTGNFNLLKSGFYQSGRGIDLSGPPDQKNWGTCI